jgi:hypothetical protein
MRFTTLAIGLLVIMAGVGCQKDEALPPHQGSQSSSTVVSESGTITPVGTETVASPGTQATTPVPVGTPAASSGRVIASTEGEQPGVIANVTELKRGSGGTLMVRFSVVNNGSQDFDFGYALGEPGAGQDYQTVAGVHLIDPVNKKKYFVVRDADGKCVCSRDLRAVKPGESRNLWAKIPAPPPEVQSATLIIPKFIPIDDAPIS